MSGALPRPTALLPPAAMSWPALRFSRESQFIWAAFRGLGALAFIAFGAATLLFLSRRLAAPARERLRPALLLGSIGAALAGGGWAFDTLVHWQRSGDLEAYGVVLGAVLAAQGCLTFWSLERTAGGPGPSGAGASS